VYAIEEFIGTKLEVFETENNLTDKIMTEIPFYNKVI